MAQLFQFNQFFYWLALSAWLGGTAFIMIIVPVVFRTVREYDPTLPTVLSVNLDGAHASLLATTIVVNLFAMLVRVELAAAAIMLATLAGQWAWLGTAQVSLSIIRTLLFCGAVAVLLYEWRVVLPRVQQYRKEYIDKADEPEPALAARQQFEANYRENITLLIIRLVFILALVPLSTLVSISTPITFIAR